MKWHKVLNTEDVKYPFIKKVKVGNVTIALVGVENEICALAARCPHAGEDLSSGWCKDGKLVCPVHRYSYDIHTGRGNPGQGDYVDTYPVEIRKDGVYVGIKEKWGFVKKLFR
ncbi:nitrite reductase/ring-hydroxylating ferredoxin subunit [Mucilaginibacter gracilis]|uniref:Nitrite reductase/ring-hydroxylating ferredoxin subunit n=1 Tax=Mucilaginibacter gracilis TaxID=423350 RepID=A0A495J2M5_9SPHI|nr:Rieske 2Fe-2S domain-containing protein [Mucilaginibacter gracilis]RKR83236.1 nitrite reductase/ring-hydroxylating ferredoxin subunit [Mucilaginibacter gracilis]